MLKTEVSHFNMKAEFLQNEQLAEKTSLIHFVFSVGLKSLLPSVCVRSCASLRVSWERFSASPALWTDWRWRRTSASSRGWVGFVSPPHHGGAARAAGEEGYHPPLFFREFVFSPHDWTLLISSTSACWESFQSPYTLKNSLTPFDCHKVGN